MQADYTITLLDTIGQLQGRDVVMIFGKTRAGKSTFINDAYQTRILESKTSMLSDTHTISYVEPPLQVDDSKVYLVDTIGLGGSEALENRMILASQWTCIFCPDLDSVPGKPRKKGRLHPTVRGFFYFIDITDAAGLNEDNQLNLDFFKRLVGLEVLKSVIFVTTKWASSTDRARRVQEARFREWEKKINEKFPGAKLIRLDDSTSRWSDEDLAEMSADEAKAEKAQYHENSMAALRLLLSKPATSATSLETEIQAAQDGGGAMGDIGIVNVAIEEARGKAESLDKMGKHIEANRIRGSADKIAAIRVSDAMERYKESLRRNQEAFAEMFDSQAFGNAMGHVYAQSYRICMGIWSLPELSNEAQQRALQQAFDERMVHRWGNFIKNGAQQGAAFGVLGRYAGGYLGWGLANALNILDGAMSWVAAADEGSPSPLGRAILNM